MKPSVYLALLALSLPTGAADVYNSPGDDGAPAGVTQVPTDGNAVALNLYIDGGPVDSPAGDKCTGDGTGDELCAWDIAIGVSDGMAIDDFLPEAGVVASFDATALRANGLDAFSPTAGPQRIGTLTVSSLGDGELTLVSGIAVTSALAAEPLSTTLLAATDVEIDTDGDGVPDSGDNCILVSNADQRDSNGDGFGNVCDADLNDDNVVNVIDLGLLRSVFFTNDADADFNGDGIVNAIDLGTLKLGFFSPPGPSGLQP